MGEWGPIFTTPVPGQQLELAELLQGCWVLSPHPVLTKIGI